VVMYVQPTIADFQAYFNRDFPYGNANLTTVNDADIQKGLSQQQNVVNPELFPNQNLYTQGALLLAAHFMVLNLRAASQGIAGRPQWLEASKSVGSVASSFNIPERILENAEMSMYCQTTYGWQYLQMILPFLVAPMVTVAGATVGPPFGGLFTGPFGAIGPWNGTPQ
jgi:Protein of unknown function (DUF4054)